MEFPILDINKFDEYYYGNELNRTKTNIYELECSVVVSAQRQRLNLSSNTNPLSEVMALKNNTNVQIKEEFDDRDTVEIVDDYYDDQETVEMDEDEHPDIMDFEEEVLMEGNVITGAITIYPAEFKNRPARPMLANQTRSLATPLPPRVNSMFMPRSTNRGTPIPIATKKTSGFPSRPPLSVRGSLPGPIKSLPGAQRQTTSILPRIVPIPKEFPVPQNQSRPVLDTWGTGQPRAKVPPFVSVPNAKVPHFVSASNAKFPMPQSPVIVTQLLLTHYPIHYTLNGLSDANIENIRASMVQNMPQRFLVPGTYGWIIRGLNDLEMNVLTNDMFIVLTLPTVFPLHIKVQYRSIVVDFKNNMNAVVHFSFNGERKSGVTKPFRLGNLLDRIMRRLLVISLPKTNPIAILEVLKTIIMRPTTARPRIVDLKKCTILFSDNQREFVMDYDVATQEDNTNTITNTTVRMYLKDPSRLTRVINAFIILLHAKGQQLFEALPVTN
jgi:hypothetical protein